ncbi:ABC transporter permease subunit [Terrilactibacillus sp. BCM23-1]|uniref:ABC transporter permease subunit n=1 Tax=Terrilactibacillus tamarindi TaxID=2599694 RepID=A0A6N8CSN1_9BACI|nr:amino acid ABC transporter permease [Terrilactibacillus tamarindi]MTT32207.1 ABC transporter permease subunit [Terrilactibacillus tamarindi]
MDVLNNLDFATAFRALLPDLLGGLWISVEATVAGFILAVVIGVLIALGRLSKSKLLNGILVVFLEIVRGTPLLVQLVYMYYVVPLLIMLVVQFWQPSFQFTFSPFLAGMLGLGINYGCYLSEVVRSAILSIDKGQTEAALALGYTNRQSMWSIVMPQAIRNSVPVFGNYLVMMIKDTSLLAFITVSELLLRTQTYASQTFLTIESYTILALAYLVISLPLAQIMRLLEKRLLKHG